MPHKNHTGMNHKNHAEWIYKDNFTQRTLLLQKYFVTVVTTETSHKNHRGIPHKTNTEWKYKHVFTQRTSTFVTWKG